MRKLLLLLPLCAISTFRQPALANQLGLEMAHEVYEHLENVKRFNQMGQRGLACDEAHSANAVMNVWFNEIKKVRQFESAAFRLRINVQKLANLCITHGYLP